MSENSSIGATGDAGQTVRAAGSFDPGAPSASEMRAVTGPSGFDQDPYRAAMNILGSTVSRAFVDYLQIIHKDLANAESSIHALQDLDAEIAATLQQVDVPRSIGKAAGKQP